MCGVGGNVMDGYSVYPRQWGGLGAQPTTEFVHPLAFSLHLEKHCARIIGDESGQAELAGNAVDERTKANPLDNTGHGEAPPNIVDSQHQGGVGHLNRPPG